MKHPFRFLLGYVRLHIPKEAAGELINLCRARGFLYWNFSFCGAHACLDCRFFDAKGIVTACRERGISAVVYREYGLPALFFRYRKRVGVWIGLAVLIGLLALSEQVIWDVRVEGNTQLSEEAVEEALRECGLSVGEWRRDLDIDAIENRVLIESDEISWISVNVVGTVANVEIREVEAIPEAEPVYGAADLVAARSGTVENFEDVRGNVVVSVGDDVAEGDLLVGGLYGGEGIPARYTCAKGRVLARTEHDFSVDIPLDYEKKVYTGRVFEEKYLIFFEKEVKFFGNTGNLPLTCDTIETVAYAQTPSGDDLPIGIRTLRYYEYEIEPSRHSEESAAAWAHYALRVQMASELAGAEIRKMHTSGMMTDTHYQLACRVGCIENIARTVEIPLRGLP